MSLSFPSSSSSSIDDWAILSGFTLVHQFCHIGAHSFSGMGTAIGKDVPAFVTVFGSPAEARSMNFEGMRRRGFSEEAMQALRRAYKVVSRKGLTVEAGAGRTGRRGRPPPGSRAVLRLGAPLDPRHHPLSAMTRPLKVALVAGEVSGEILGAGLMQAIKARHPDAQFIGVGGPRCRPKAWISTSPWSVSAVMGLVEVLGRLPELLGRSRPADPYPDRRAPRCSSASMLPTSTSASSSSCARPVSAPADYVSPSVSAWAR